MHDVRCVQRRHNEIRGHVQPQSVVMFDRNPAVASDARSRGRATKRRRELDQWVNSCERGWVNSCERQGTVKKKIDAVRSDPIRLAQQSPKNTHELRTEPPLGKIHLHIQ